MVDIKDFDYINEKDRKLVNLFIESKDIKKYILGINKYTKAIQKHISVDGIIDDFTRVQKSRKKEILDINQIDKNSIVLWVSWGSPLEVKEKLDSMGIENISYLAFYKYSSFTLPFAPFMDDFEEDFKQNKEQYEKIFNLLEDEKSRTIFQKVLNFKITGDYSFMKGFTNNHDEQYFDKEIIPNIKNICFVDGGGYVGDTIPNIVNNFPDYKKIYSIEPNKLHINIAKKKFADIPNIEFIECGLSNKKIMAEDNISLNNCDHNYNALNTDTLDNIIKDKVDFIKMDIEGAEQAAIEGAKQTIKKFKPILAICIYHKAEDWYKIPQMVLSIDSGYKLYLRHYMEGIYETVLYFVPKSNDIK
ncbi:FkbM family methyltransferase [Campylobacterota bacterium DY0563]